MNKTGVLDYNKEFITSRRLAAVIGVSFFVMATILGAYVRIPIKASPVPITLQTFFVILAGAVLGKKLGMRSMSGYMLLGLFGLPVFQGAAYGMSVFAGPTGGYLIGFVLAAYFIGYMTRSGKQSLASIVAIFAAGSLLIDLSGTVWLICLYKMNPLHAASLGILPFIPGDITKTLIAAIIYSRISNRVKNIFSV